MNNKNLGDVGEKRAVRYLKLRGYKILNTKFSTKLGEIDIIAKDKNTLVFVEVKTRTNLSHGDPKDSVNYYKKMHIINAAKLYIDNNNLYNISARFDVIEVLAKQGRFVMRVKINHIKDAFYSDDV